MRRIEDDGERALVSRIVSLTEWSLQPTQDSLVYAARSLDAAELGIETLRTYMAMRRWTWGTGPEPDA